MKNISKVIVLLLSLNLSANDISWVDHQIDAIWPTRKGLDLKSLKFLKDPMIFLHKITKVSKSKIPLKEKALVGTTTNNSVTNSSSAIVPAAMFVKKVFKYSFVLEAIINKSVLVNGRWYKIGDKIKGYQLRTVTQNTAVLKRGRKTMTLTTVTKHNTLQFNQK